MVKRELVQYIEGELRKGLHISAVRKALLDVGHDIHSIEEAMLHVQKRGRHHHHLVKYVIPIFLMLVLVLFAVFLREKEPEVAQDIKEEVTDKLIGDVDGENDILETDGEIGEVSTLLETDGEILDRAILNRDPEICKKITDSDLMAICLDTVTPPPEDEQAAVVDKTDESLIDQAVLSRDSSICLEIQDVDLQNQCLLIVQG